MWSWFCRFVLRVVVSGFCLVVVVVWLVDCWCGQLIVWVGLVLLVGWF